VGSALVRFLIAGGSRVALAGRDEAALQQVANDNDALCITADAGEFDEVNNCVKRTAEWGGRLDGVVNCAGSVLLKPAHLTTRAEFDEVMAKNLVSAFATVRAAANAMRKEGGSIVLMSSAAASVGLANHEAIAAAKGGVEGLTRSAAATYAAHGVRVNAVALGLVDTPATGMITKNTTALAASTAFHPLGRVGKVEDVVPALSWLLSPDSSWVTGQVVGVDGGLARLKTRVKV
jgi:NAD(P)-dependent dehydrogenase (short-subunit alcohol dehydrogenase family)